MSKLGMGMGHRIHGKDATMQRLERAGTPAVFAVVFVLYFAGGALAWWTIQVSGLGAVFFPPAGMTVVAYLSLPRQKWPVVAAGVVSAELATGLTIGGSTDMISLLGFAAANAIGPLIGAIAVGLLLRRPREISSLPDLGRRHELIMFAIAGVALGPFVSGVIGAATAAWRFGTPFSSLGLQWWLGDALGVMVVAPVLMAWRATRGPRAWRGVGALTLVTVAWVGSMTTLAISDLPLLFLTLGALIAAGALFDVRTVALTGLVMSVVVGVTLALDHNGLMTGVDAKTALTIVKLEFLVFAVAGYFVAAEANERVITADELTRRSATVDLLQRLLLPPLAVSGAGFRVRGTYDAAVHDVGVGGDWYLARPTLDGRLVVAVGDIVGHDLDAARTMASVRSGLVLDAAINPDAAGILNRLDAFSEVEPAIRYSTAWAGVFDPKTRRLDYACAGHPPPLLSAGDKIERLTGANSAVIGLPQGARGSASVTIPHGASLVMYSDGLVESRHAPIDDGIARLESSIATMGLEPQPLLDEMLRNSLREDDTVLAVIDFDHEATDQFGDFGYEVSWDGHRAPQEVPAS